MSARVSEGVHDRLRGQILDGTLRPGAAVPSERALAEELGVGRHAVREALKRLQQAGLVQISQGGATRVLDWRESGGLELLLDLFESSSAQPGAELVRAVLETRATIGVDAARRCAERAERELRQRIREKADQTAGAIGSGDDAAAVDAGYEELWQLIVAGSGNIAYRLALNSLVGGIQRYERIAAALRPGDPVPVKVLGEAVAAGSADEAAAAAGALLGPDARAVG
jgi:GntR family transcriptional repressor for pyruvate dehydrogenase complex